MSQSTRIILLFSLFVTFHGAAWGWDFKLTYRAEFRAGTVAMRPIENYNLPDGVTRWSPGVGIGLKLYAGPVLGADFDYAFIYRTLKTSGASSASIVPTSFLTVNLPVRVSWSAKDYVAPLVGFTFESFSSTKSISTSANSEWLLSQMRVHSGVQLKTQLFGISFQLEGALAMISIANFERARKGVAGFNSSYWFTQTDFPVYQIDGVDSYLSLRYGNSYRTHMRDNVRAASREESVFLISGTKY